MKLSWSQKLFLKINKNVGKSPLVDKIMYFCGQWLIFILVGVVAILCFTGLYPHERMGFFILSAIAFLLAYGISYGTALVWKHPRPVLELPHVKQLITPVENWKSFPSDHTITVTLLSGMAYFLTGSNILLTFIFISAVLVMCGRVYSGVHYPRDILGGLFLGLFTMGCSLALYTWFTQLPF